MYISEDYIRITNLLQYFFIMFLEFLKNFCTIELFYKNCVNLFPGLWPK